MSAKFTLTVLAGTMGLALLACARGDVPAPAIASPTPAPEIVLGSPASPAGAQSAPLILTIPTAVPTPTPVVFPSDQVGEGTVLLQIPSLGINAPLEVAEEVMGSNGPAFTLPRENPLWVPGWGAEIGGEGVALIYGHRQWGPVRKIFTALDRLEAGDIIFVTDGERTLAFAVTEAVVVYPNDFWSTFFRADDGAMQEGQIQIALVTCTPWGSDRQRLIVFAELTEEEVTREEILIQP